MADQPIAQAGQQPRVIRVFVSSTFRDMAAERDELIKRIFPQLRRLCEERGVTWGEVDLRWGVTDEQKAEGKVLPICLEEIHRCRPYFIGLLGERYGWIPDAIDPDLIARQPWLAEHRSHSVTELEILHGVLNNPQMADHAYFYFRSPSYIDSLPTDQRAVYREIPTPEEIAAWGAAEAQRRADERRAKLAALKERIRASGLPVREDYRDPIELGQLVLSDLTAVIDRLYPPGSQPDPLARDAAEHEAFARKRARVYIGRQEYFDRLDAHARGDGLPLVLVGESGVGKSALLANWTLRYRDAHPDDLLIMHFIGATPYSADWAAMLRRIMGELQRRFAIQGEIPDQPDALRLAFATWLHMAAARGRVVLILDALNQLEDRDQAPDLVWLPPVMPDNVRLILSSLPGRPLDELSRRRWPTLAVQPLRPDEGRRLIEQVLAKYSKSLSPARTERIANAPQTANPLYLHALLDELRQFGSHERLDERIGYYLEARTIDDLYERILERYEEDYQRERPGLVREAMSLLWAARRGLSEAELLELLGRDGQPLPAAHWAPLYLAAEQGLVSRSGLIGFAHEYLRQAVGDRYLPGEEAQQAAHLRLAAYFAARELGPRQIDELPWQLAQAQAWQILSELLAAPPFFAAAWQANEFEVKGYWAQVEAHSSLRMVDAYRPVLRSPDRDPDHSWRVAVLFYHTGHLTEALALQHSLVEHFRRAGDRDELSACLGNQALILRARGDLDGAMALLKEVERLCRELGNKDGLQTALGNQALILQTRGDLDGAMALHKEKERLCRELGNKDGLSACLGNQANILYARGDLDGAMALLKEKERLSRELGNKDGLQACLGNQALILRARGDLDGAMALHKEKERLCRELGNKDGLQRTLGNQAVILQARGDLDGAMALHKEEERLCRELGNKDGLSRSLGNQALILRARGDLDGAMALLKEQERLCRELGNPEGLAISLANQAVTMARKGRGREALALAEEAYRLASRYGYSVLAQQIQGILARLR